MTRVRISTRPLVPATIARWSWQRCKVHRSRRAAHGSWILHTRCALRRDHMGMHAIERGFDVVWFSGGRSDR